MSSFTKNSGEERYTSIICNSRKAYFSRSLKPKGQFYTAEQICQMIDFLVDNIFIKFGGQIFRQVIGIPMGTNCAPLLADLFLYSYENEFLESLIKSRNFRLAKKFNFCFRYIDDLICFNHKTFDRYLKHIYPVELTAKRENEGTDHYASYLDLSFHVTKDDELFTKLYDKRDNFDFHIVNFQFLSGNIPAAPAYGVYISQLIRYARCCTFYEDFSLRHSILASRLVLQGYSPIRLMATFKKFYARYETLISKYNQSVTRMMSDSIPYAMLKSAFPSLIFT